MHTSDGRVLTVRRGWQHSGRWLVAFEEIPDRTSAGDLRGGEELIDGPETEEEDGWYAHELAGLKVQLDSGEENGEVVGHEHLLAQDAFIVREPSATVP